MRKLRLLYMFWNEVACSAVHVNTCVRTFGSSIHAQQINIYIFYAKMFDINICNATTGEMVCVIFDVDPDLTLDNLRKRIENEAREFITKDFRFTMAGVTLSLGQEETILVTNAIKYNHKYKILLHAKCTNITINHHDKQQQP